MSKITTHVLDTVAGEPAAGIPVTLQQSVAGEWGELARAVTDADGRARDLLPDDYALQPGLYSLRFETARVSAFFPEVVIRFRIDDPARHYHVPLLLSAYGYSTYRGS